MIPEHTSDWKGLARGAGLFILVYGMAYASRMASFPGEEVLHRLLTCWLLIATVVAALELSRRHGPGWFGSAIWLASSVAFIFLATRHGPPNAATILALKDLAQLSVALILGRLLADRIDSGETLLAIGILVVITDLWSVSVGVTRSLIEAEALDYFLLNFPVLGEARTGYFIGTSDFILAVVYIRFVSELDVPPWRWRLPLALGAALALAGTTAIVLNRGLPALPFLVPAAHLAIPQPIRLGREGWKLIGAGLLMIAGMAWVLG